MVFVGACWQEEAGASMGVTPFTGITGTHCVCLWSELLRNIPDSAHQHFQVSFAEQELCSVQES